MFIEIGVVKEWSEVLLRRAIRHEELRFGIS